jgi:hypothetical protein
MIEASHRKVHPHAAGAAGGGENQAMGRIIRKQSLKMIGVSYPTLLQLVNSKASNTDTYFFMAGTTSFFCVFEHASFELVKK